MMGHHVVQLARDPLALGLDGGVGALLALGLQPLLAVLLEAGVQASRAGEVAEGPREADDQLGLEQALQATRDAAKPGDEDREARSDGHGERDRRTPVATLRDRVERHERAESLVHAGAGRGEPCVRDVAPNVTPRTATG